MHQYGLLIIQLLVLHLTVQLLLGQQRLPAFHLLQALADLGSGPCSGDNVQPVLLGGLVGVGQDFHLVTALQFLAYGNVLVADAGSHTLVSYL